MPKPVPQQGGKPQFSSKSSSDRRFREAALKYMGYRSAKSLHFLHGGLPYLKTVSMLYLVRKKK
jgi:hypothetical protein